MAKSRKEITNSSIKEVANSSIIKLIKINSSEQRKLILSGIIVGALLGGLVQYIVTSELSYEQYQKEQHNIARALYVDISHTENNLKADINQLSDVTNNNPNALNNPGFFMISQGTVYGKDGLYYVFSKDISGFDSNISRDLYDFYSNVITIETETEFLGSLPDKYGNVTNVSGPDLRTAHRYTADLFKTNIPICINQAENLKKELNQIYKIDISN